MRLLIVLTVASTFWAAVGAAQPAGPSRVFGQYQQINWQQADGLPQNTVTAVTTTRDGYVWVGTYEGAARFDGVRFTVFNATNTHGIGNSLITSLLEDRTGDLWLATYGGGLSRLSGGHFTQYTKRDGLSTDFVLRLFEDTAGMLWIATDGGGLNSFRDGRFTAYTVQEGLPSNVVRAVVDDGGGALLVGTSRGIARIEAGRVSAYRGRADLAQADISTLGRARDGSLWVAANGASLYRVDARGVTQFGPREGLSDGDVEALHVDQAGEMWVGTSQGGLFRYSAGRFQGYTPAAGLPGARVPAIAQGSDKDLWVGTDGGLVRLKQPRFTVYTQHDGLASDNVGSIFRDADGSIWIGSSNGLTRFKDGAFHVFTKKDGLPDDRIRGIGNDGGGNLWVHTRSGLAYWKQARFVEAERLGGLQWSRVTSLLQDRTGTLWLGINEDGVIRVRDGTITQLTKKDGLADDSVLTLFEDRAGSVWIGTLRGGITRIRDGQLMSWSTRDGLANDHVKAFYEDAGGALWIGTHGGGLSRFKNGAFGTISTRQGLFNDTIFQILEDDDGDLWMNCNSGIWRTSLAELNDVADGRRATVGSFGYGVGDGMLSSEGVGAPSAGAKTGSGLLWFPTTRGIVVVDPRDRNREAPRVLIEGITVDREPVPVGRSLRLAPGEENVEIQYTGLSWSRSRDINFRFRMIGLDRDWVDAGARRTAYYSHLPPGAYTFMVIADNGEGVWNTVGQSLAVVVPPPFYRTWWFVTSTTASIAAVVWLSWRRRLTKLEHSHVAQQAFSRQLIESQERERQRIAAELHDSLGQSLLVVKNRAVLGVLSQPHEQALKQFTEIGATVARTLEEVRTIAYNLRPYHLDQLGLTTAITAMIEDVADSSGVRLTRELDDIDGVFPAADEITIYRIIQEGLNNVVKHSGASEAHIAVHCRERDVEITIRDSGQGFAPDARTGDAAYPAGFGLIGLAERVHMLGGTHSIQSSPGRGTTVALKIGLRARDQGSQLGR